MSDRHNHKRAFNSQSTYNPSRPNDRRSLGNPNESKSDYTGRTKSDVKNRDRLNQSAMELPNNNIEQKRRKIMCKKYPQTPDAWEKYSKVLKIGQGTFGEVFKATRKIPDPSNKSCDVVAMKRVLMDHEKEGFPITALREIKILQTLNRKTNDYGSSTDSDNPIGHENIVRLIEVCREVQEPKGTPSVFLVFEFCEHDLHGLLTHLKKEKTPDNKSVDFTIQEKKSIVQQMLRGLMYVHGKRIFHRDMKTSNVLVNQDGTVKLADFGLARPSYVTSSRQLTNNVVTLWYRPPELLLGDNNYGSAIDIWGCGCIMAELWTKKAIFSEAKDDINQLRQITDICGSIDRSDWPTVTKLKNFTDEKYKSCLSTSKKRERQLTKKFGNELNDPLALSLLDDMLKLNPEKRISANSALDSYWLWVEPLPKKPDLKSMNIDKSQFEIFTRRQGGKRARDNGPSGGNNHNDNSRPNNGNSKEFGFDNLHNNVY